MEVTTHDAEVIAHYSRFLDAEPNIIAVDYVPEGAPKPMAVLEFPPPSDEYDWIYTTVGVSRQPMPDPDQSGEDPTGRRMELIMLSRTQSKELPDFLVALAIYPFMYNTFFAFGNLVPGRPGSGVVEGSPLTEILLTFPHFMPDDFATIHHSGGSHTHIIWLVPIHLSERLYAREHGHETLEQLFGESEVVDTSDFFRGPVA